ncbi:hypothetical protein ABH14_19695 [Brevibacillus brevis]|uniref:hypothetical protein n=1 Tax=Brevibacillus brevis TaxID=1393 RepID=UPI0019024B94|nr:hypothetical protein [Brevibacillus brevis]MBH0331951.1 hypothetical protein [Brevibacillus brevis]
MSKVHVVGRLEDLASVLQSALNDKGPYVLGINEVRSKVSHEEFLAFYIDVTIEDLWEIKELADEEVQYRQGD